MTIDAIELPTERPDPFDPPPELASLRERHPLCRLRYPDGHVGWLVTSYALARAVLVDSRFSVRPLRPPLGDPAENAAYLDGVANLPERSGVLMELDAPHHSALRRPQAGYFTVGRVREHTAAIERVVSDRLDAMEAAGPPVDLVQMFALPVPSLTTCDLLGVPHSERERFERPTAVVEDPHASAEDKVTAEREFFAYCRGVIERKRADPGADLLSDLVAAGDLTDDQLAGLALQLFSAAHETTASMLALSTFVLLCDRSRWDALRSGQASIETAVEELLRYLTIVQTGAFTRTALEDVELDGVVIRKGESVTVSLTAANRDPEKFADPDRLDLARDAKGHLAFGYGRHICLGQHLARLELHIGLSGLMRRFPALQLAVAAEDVPLHSGEAFLAGVKQLPVSW